jgi:septal ring factor EnvC (AmiA/AmiB activator)
MTTPTLIELVDSALSTQTQYALQPCRYRTGVAKKAKMALLDALEAQAAEIERLTQDRDEWKQSTIDANTNARSEEAKRRAMQDERDTLKAELAALKAQPTEPAPSMAGEPIGPARRRKRMVTVKDTVLSLMAHNDDPGYWSSSSYRDCWLEGYRAGARAIEAAHGITQGEKV